MYIWTLLVLDADGTEHLPDTLKEAQQQESDEDMPQSEKVLPLV